MNDYNLHIGTNGEKSLGALGVIQIVLIILKLFKLIDIPWKVVLIPLWIELGILFIVLIVVIIAIYIDKKGGGF